MEKALFLNALRAMDRRVVYEVSRSLLEFDPTLQQVRPFLLKAMNVPSRSASAGERVIPVSWWRHFQVSDFYVWDALARQGKSFRAQRESSFVATAIVLCYFALAEVQDSAVLLLRSEAYRFVEYFRKQELSFGVTPPIPRKVCATEKDRSFLLGDHVRRALNMSLVESDAESGHAVSCGDAWELYQVSLNPLEGFDKDFSVNTEVIQQFQAKRGPSSFMISALLHGPVTHAVAMKLELRLNGKKMRVTRELLVSSDFKGFFLYRDPAFGMCLDEEGWLEIRTVAGGKPIGSRWWPVVPVPPSFIIEECIGRMGRCLPPKTGSSVR